MRFDDTLETVLAADMNTPQGVQSLWRQLVDLIGRRRVIADTRSMATLRAIRAEVPAPVRAASARALEYADPPPPLVRLFALDEIAVALPVLRGARMNSAEWVQLLPDLAPAARSVLRNRRDLGPVVKRALEAFGPIDFVLPDETVKVEQAVSLDPVAEAPPPELPTVSDTPEEVLIDWTAVVAARPPEPARRMPAATPAPEAAASSPKPLAELLAALEAAAPPADLADAMLDAAGEAGAVPHPEPVPGTPAEPESAPPEEDFSFVELAGSAAAWVPGAVQALSAPPVVAPAVQSGTIEPAPSFAAIAPAGTEAQGPLMDQAETITAAPDASVQEAAEGDGTFEIADVVARIDAFWRHREEAGESEPRCARPAEGFRFETDAKGVIRWVDGVSRAALVGVSLDAPPSVAPGGGVQVDGVAAGAFRRRAGFSHARLTVQGESDAAGDWLISGVPGFDPANGRFTGYRGTARRPRADERAEPTRPAAATPADSLRQLVHELRTPTNAIAGFAEMIDSQMLGPVPAPYREHAHEIRSQARELLGAIDDLDLAARIDSAALALVTDRVVLRPLLATIADDLAELAALRGSAIALPIEDAAVAGDRRAVERLLARLLATLVSASGEGERIGISLALAGEMAAITIDRPRALADYPGESVLGIDDEHEDATLLGTGFALRLARNLARELGGALLIEPGSLTLRLPASVNSQVDQAHLN